MTIIQESLNSAPSNALKKKMIGKNINKRKLPGKPLKIILKNHLQNILKEPQKKTKRPMKRKK